MKKKETTNTIKNINYFKMWFKYKKKEIDEIFTNFSLLIHLTIIYPFKKEVIYKRNKPDYPCQLTMKIFFFSLTYSFFVNLTNNFFQLFA